MADTRSASVPRRAVVARSADTGRLIRVSGADETAAAPADVAGSDDAWRQFTFGRLLLFAFTAYEARILEAYGAAGYGDVRQVHFGVTRHIDVTRGTRISDLARRAGVTKSAMGQLVAECERMGLVRLVADAADGRVRLVTLAKRGRALLAVTRDASRRIEEEMAQAVGADTFAALRTGLIALRDALQPSAGTVFTSAGRRDG